LTSGMTVIGMLSISVSIWVARTGQHAPPKVLAPPEFSEIPKFLGAWASTSHAYFSTPAALAVCVAIASISAGDKQS
jgi:hypothetical protein